MAWSRMTANKGDGLKTDRTRDWLWVRDQREPADLMRLKSECQGQVIFRLCRPLQLLFIIGQRNEANALSREIASVPVVGTF